MAHVSWRYECIADMTLLFISLKGMLGLCTYMSDMKNFGENFLFPEGISGIFDFRFFSLLRFFL